MGSRRLRVVLLGMLVPGLAVVSLAVAAGTSSGKSPNQFTAVLNGYDEVPAVHTAGHGRLDADGERQQHVVVRADLRRSQSAAALFAHVHFAQQKVNGGISFFLCGGGGKPSCPAGT